MQESNGNIRFLSVISYIGVLFVVGHFALERDNPDLRFHTYQGGVLCGCFMGLYAADLVVWMLLSVVPPLQMDITMLLTIGISVAYLMLMVMGIKWAWNFEQKLLPFIGKVSIRLRMYLDSRRNNR